MKPLTPDEQTAAVEYAQMALWRVVVGRFGELEASDGLRQADLAERLGVSRPQIHEWLSDPRQLTLKAASRLLAAMGARLDFEARPARRPRLRPMRPGPQVRRFARGLGLALLAGAGWALGGVTAPTTVEAAVEAPLAETLEIAARRIPL